MKAVVLVMFALFTFHAQGAEVDTSKLCKKMQSCILEELRSQAMPEGMMQMMQPTIDNMCTDMDAKFTQAPNQMHKDIAACLAAMEAADCDTLMNNTDQLQACESLDEKY